MKQALSLWLLVFAGPLAWFLDLEANFAFSTQICAGAWSAAPAVISVLAVLCTAAAGMLLRLRFREMRATQPPAPQVYQITAIGGMLLSTAFVIVIVAESIPVIMLRNCR